MRDILFWGATGQSRVLHEALLGTDLNLIAVIDNDTVPPPIPGIPVLRGESGLLDLVTRRARPSDLLFTIAVGGSKGRDRLELFDAVRKHGLTPFTIIHRTAFVATDAILGEACQILAMAAICSCARLGRAVIVNTSASIDHDCDVGNGAHIGPGAHLAGHVRIGARCFIGTGAVILPGIQIGADSIVGAGSVVLRDVPALTKVAGNPARPIKQQGEP